jgi:hypothetical protein
LRLGQQPHAEHRAALAIGPVACADAAAVAFHQALAVPQAQAVAVILGREVGAEQAFFYAGRQGSDGVQAAPGCQTAAQGCSAVQPQYLLRHHIQPHFAGAAFDRVRLRA